MAISTHVLDLSRGRPARGIHVVLERLEGGAARRVAEGETDADGRVASLLPAGTAPEPGTWRLTFETGAWFEREGLAAFYPRVEITFLARPGEPHHHVPLLLSPFGYSTYRGS